MRLHIAFLFTPLISGLLISGLLMSGLLMSGFLISGARAEMPADPLVAGRARYAPLLAAEAARRGIPAALADAVATVESAYDPRSFGADGEVGLMQVLPSTAAMLGFTGTPAQLADPETNIRYGVLYLAGAWVATGGRLCDTLMKYRAGYGTQVMSLRSVNYCRHARDTLAAAGSPLAEGPGTELPPITPEMLAEDAAFNALPRRRMPILTTAAERVRLRGGHRTAADSAHYWEREKAYIRALEASPRVRRLAARD